MKLLSSDPAFFSDVSDDLKSKFDKISVFELGFKNGTPASDGIIVSDHLEPDALVNLSVQSKLNHLIQKNPGLFEDELKATCLLIENPDEYFNSGIKSYLHQPKIEWRKNFSKPSQKRELMEDCERFLSQLGSRNVGDSAIAIMEELYMNAVFDAPQEAFRQKLASDGYENGKTAKMLLSSCGKKLVLTCIDPYGSMDLRSFMRHLDEVYKKGPGAVMNERNSIGAGIGCFMMLENCSSLFIGVHQGKATAVSCMIPLGMGNRTRTNLKKSLHLIIKEK